MGDNDRENISGNIALNWAPSDATQFTFKGSYNRLHDKELSHALYFEGGTDEYDDDGNLIEPQSSDVLPPPGSYQEPPVNVRRGTGEAVPPAASDDFICTCENCQ